MKTTISKDSKESIFGDLQLANQAFNKIYKGDREDRQPIHTVYGGANLFKYNTTGALGASALKSLLTYAPNFIAFGKAFQLQGYETFPTKPKAQKRLIQKVKEASEEEFELMPAAFSYKIYNKVIDKLESEAIEDFRIDFEDGFGNRSDEEEDETAAFTAKEVAKGMKEGTISPFIGIRIKPFTEELKERGDYMLSELGR